MSSGWLPRASLAGSVLAAAVVATLVALNAPAPSPLPGVALGSEAIFRAVVGFCCFVAIYGPLTLFTLALNGWLPVRVGTKETSFEKVVGAQSVAVEGLSHELTELQGEVRELGRSSDLAKESVADRLQRLEIESERRLRDLEARTQALVDQRRAEEADEKSRYRPGLRLSTRGRS